MAMTDQMEVDLREWLIDNEMNSPTHLEDIWKLLEIIAEHLQELEGSRGN
jgi:hypothetical protein